MDAQLTDTAIGGTYPDGNVPRPQPGPKTRNAWAFMKVVDSRGHRIRRLWQRNNRFYAQLSVPGKRRSTKIPLVDASGAPVRTVPEARDALHELLKQRRTNTLPILTRTPALEQWVQRYIDWLRRSGAKSPLTIAKEAAALANWVKRYGAVRLAHFRRAHVNEFIAWRKDADRVTNRTVNLDVIALNNCFRHAIDEELLQRLPTEGWKPLEHVSPRRPPWTADNIERLCLAALREGSPDVFIDYLRFLAFTGARRNEALHVEWAHVDFDRSLVTLCKTKFGRPRHIDFNPRLAALLTEMRGRRSPGSIWLFPNPARPSEPARDFRLQLEAARAAAELPTFQFHDLRHYFISQCVMAGIDYMTIARWVGHKDGGILIGKVYGHLNDAHARKMAEKLTAL